MDMANQKELINLFKDYIECEKKYTLEKISVYAYEYDKANNNISFLKGDKAIKIYKKAARELFQISEDILNNNGRDIEKVNQKITQALEDVNKGYVNEETYLKTLNYSGELEKDILLLNIELRICDYMNFIKNNFQFLDKEKKYTIAKMNFYHNLIDFLDSIFDNSTFIVSPREMYKVLLESNLKTIEKYNIMTVICHRLKNTTLKHSDKNNPIYTMTEKHLKDIGNIKDIDDINDESLQKFMLNIGFSKNDIEEIKISKEVKKIEEKEPIKINIESSLDIYEKKEQENQKQLEILKQHFNLKDMQLISFLDRDNMNKVLKILKNLKYENKIITQCIWDNELLLKNKDLLDKCNYYLDKAKFYSSKYGFEQEYNNFKEYYNGYLTSTDDEDKQLYLEYLEISYTEIKSILDSIPRNYEYEKYISNEKKDLKILLKK